MGGGSPFRSRNSTAPVPVKAVNAERKSLAVHLRAIGTVTPLNTVTVRSRVEGQLVRVLFQEGQQVQQGQVLAEIDPQPYQIRLAQMEARQRQNAAQLQTARADLERFRQLHAQTLVTQQQLEAQQALVADREGALAADQAATDDARRQLAYTKIEAPIAGRLGLRQVDAGNLIRPGDAGGLVVLTQTRPIAVTFTIPEIDLQKVLEPLRAGETLAVEAWDRSEQTLLASGALKTVDNQIDLATGTLRLKAEFPNDDEKLFPNQFVNVRLRVRTLRDAVVIPAAAVQYGSRGTYVYLVNEESKATVREIVLGPADGSLQAVTSGLQHEEKVILEGLDRLREGRLVAPVGADGLAQLPPPGAEKSAGGDRGGKGEKSGGKGERGKKKDK
ncbi:MAG: MdtA/MuxA family multidrug efflux RND transporter periplasmic adaptor subunit [Verrucomicrobia bacterium]|nr:MdtA/MuxA family multidrug efflux RND transporter periplasmic adaptor subunit [Verrucomicrobiota bacterium]